VDNVGRILKLTKIGKAISNEMYEESLEDSAEEFDVSTDIQYTGSFMFKEEKNAKRGQNRGDNSTTK